MDEVIEIQWGSPAQKYILGEYPKGVERKTRIEIQARIGYAIRQAQRWLEEAYLTAWNDNGEDKFAFGMARADEWSTQAKVLKQAIA